MDEFKSIISKKVFFLGYKGYGFMYDWIETCFLDNLRHEGIIISTLYIDLYLDIDIQVENLVSKLLLFCPDLLISACDDRFLTQDVCSIIKSLSVPSVLFCCDNLTVPFKHKKSTKYFDLTWLTSYETSRYFTKWGATTIFMPYAANPYFVNTNSIASVNNNVIFVGSLYGGRSKRIANLERRGINVHVYSNNQALTTNTPRGAKIAHLNTIAKSLPFILSHIKYPLGRKIIRSSIYSRLTSKPHRFKSTIFHKPPKTFLELSKIYQESKLVIGSMDVFNTHVMSVPLQKVHMRFFEAPMNYGLQICSRKIECAAYFQENENILYYDSYEEMSDKIQFYTHPDRESQVSKMKLNARYSSVRMHSWAHRVLVLFNKLGIK